MTMKRSDNLTESTIETAAKRKNYLSFIVDPVVSAYQEDISIGHRPKSSIFKSVFRSSLHPKTSWNQSAFMNSVPRKNLSILQQYERLCALQNPVSYRKVEFDHPEPHESTNNIFELKHVVHSKPPSTKKDSKSVQTSLDHAQDVDNEDVLPEKNEAKQNLESDHNPLSSLLHSLHNGQSRTEALSHECMLRVQEASEARLAREPKLEELLEKSLSVLEKPRVPKLLGPMNKKIDEALKCPCKEYSVKKFKQSVQGKSLLTLAPDTWLNDEVINYYLELIKGTFERVHFMNTFFYNMLSTQGFQKVRRWTRLVNLHKDFDLLFIPVHLSVHWILVAVDFQRKTIRAYDSLNGWHSEVVQTIGDWLVEEAKTNHQLDIYLEEWSMTTISKCPKQRNGSDCGVFTCIAALYLAQKLPLTYSAEEMRYFRRKMVYEIVTGELLPFG